MATFFFFFACATPAIAIESLGDNAISPLRTRPRVEVRRRCVLQVLVEPGDEAGLVIKMDIAVSGRGSVVDCRCSAEPGLVLYLQCGAGHIAWCKPRAPRFREKTKISEAF